MKFIPRISKDTSEGIGSTPQVLQRRRTFRIFNFFSSAAFTVAFVFAIGVIVYNEYIERKLVIAKQQLSEVSASDQRANVALLGAFDARVFHARRLLSLHMAPSEIFRFIEEGTRATVQVSAFSYRYDPGFDIFLSYSGTTNAFGTVALQELTLADSPLFMEYDMKNITYSGGQNGSGESGAETKVSFSVQGLVDKNLLAFERDLLPAEEVAEFPVETRENPPAIEGDVAENDVTELP